MKKLLYLVHRLPYPPNKGDKISSNNMLNFFSERWRVHLGTFIDDPDDWQ
ncbi:MAG: sugar transferase, partial [Halioglobus sp.]|nr:sugar transferase [Halioglobus sp.]